MTYQKIFLQCTMLAALSLLFTASANAAKIINMDSEAHEITLKISDEMKTITIKPGRSWRSTEYPMYYIKDDGSELLLDQRSEYAIWSGGRFVLKKARLRGGTNY